MITIEIWDKTLIDEIKRLEEDRREMTCAKKLHFMLGALTALRWIMDRKVSPSNYAKKS
jgi:hypothetical protein